MNQTQSAEELIKRFEAIVGASSVVVQESKMEPFCKGFRMGSGKAMAVLRPRHLVDIWRALEVCVEQDLIVIMQAANTGLTGGSTPDGNDYDRPIVIINTMYISNIHVIENGAQIVALSGATLFGLEEKLAPYGREPHSVIGSSCIGASIVGGICNNSGGALVQRGPAYTELAIYAQVDANGELELVNNLGIDLGETPAQILNALEQGGFAENAIHQPDKRASDNEYDARVRDIDAPTPSRFNNDGRRLFEASGCAGKLAVFAVRLDTFLKPETKKVFYLGTNDPASFTKIRRHILASFSTLPVSGEYLDSVCYDISKNYGKDMFIMIDKLGASFIPKLFEIKRNVDRWANKLPFAAAKFSDKFMQALSKLFPNHLPKRMEEFRDKYQHYWMIEASGEAVAQCEQYFSEFFEREDGDYFVCTEREAEQAILHRFVAGGAIGRYHMMRGDQVGDLMTMDIAFPRNELDWFESLPPEIDDLLDLKIYYGHFFCHVMHQNYVVKKGVDAKALKQKLLESYDARGAEYPAEHNVGHEYKAKQPLVDFYMEIDPTNAMNPGIGHTSKCKHYK